MVILMLGHH